MKGRRTKPRVECERGRVVKTRTEYRKKQKGALNMNAATEWAGSRTEMRNNIVKQRKEGFGETHTPPWTMHCNYWTSAFNSPFLERSVSLEIFMESGFSRNLLQLLSRNVSYKRMGGFCIGKNKTLAFFPLGKWFKYTHFFRASREDMTSLPVVRTPLLFMWELLTLIWPS